MSAYQALVLNNVCRSNHHRIAIMALEHLKAHENERWRDLFLKYHPVLLEGSKAPDEEFKDFKNHVCHPEDNFWGGAPKAASEWYRRTVRALSEQDWEHAVWNAGVMSHYLADPCQPFHTGQSEAEGVIHRAAEWSFSKAFPELKLIIEQHVHWPEVKIPSGEEWIEQIVRDAATNSHKYYHAMIDHYHLDAARKKPEAGLDQELKDIAARQIAYATVVVARVVDRAIAESKAQAPKVSLALSTLLVGIKKPLHVVLKKLDHKEDRKLVEAQYAEFRRTGKVRQTLSEDDKIVRALHAEEVTGQHISSVDAEWPREHGLEHGTGAEPRVHKKIKKKVKDGETEAGSASQEFYDKPSPKAEKAAAKAAAKANARAQAEASRTEAKAPQKAETKPNAKADAKPAAKAEAAPADARVRLTRAASVVDAPSIGPKTAGRLNLVGIKTVGDLLEVSPEDAAARIKQGHINARLIKDWQAQALLACSVPDLSGTAAQMLVGAGVSSLDDLASADPDFLVDAITLFANSPEGERALRNAAPPARERVKGWIEAALKIAEKRSAA